MSRGAGQIWGGSLKFLVARRVVKSNISMWKGDHMILKANSNIAHRANDQRT